MVPQCLAAASGPPVGVGLTRMASTLAGGGHSAVAPSVAEAMEAGFLPALDEDQADMFTPLELRLPLACCTDTLRTTGYKPGISWVIPVSLVISLVNP